MKALVVLVAPLLPVQLLADSTHNTLPPVANDLQVALAQYSDLSSTYELSRETIYAWCASPDFDLTPTNWLSLAGPEWLQLYVDNHAQKPAFRTRGLLTSLAASYLHNPNISCGLDSIHRCSLSCPEIVRNLDAQGGDRLYLARVLYLTFLQAQHLAESLETIHGGLLAAQTNVGQMAAEMSREFYHQKSAMERNIWLNTVEFIIDATLNCAMSFLPVPIPGAVIRSAVIKQITAEKQKIGSGPRLSEGLREWAKTKVKLLKKTAEAVGQGVTEHAGNQAVKGVAYGAALWKRKMSYALNSPGSEYGGEINQLMITEYVRRSSMAARESLRAMADALFSNGADVEGLDSDEYHPLVALMYYGHFLGPGKDGALATYHAPEIEQKLTHGLMLKALNAAWTTQKIYITCTKDYRRTDKPHRPSASSPRTPAGSCARDNVGPVDFKACVDGWACYLYKWSDRGLSMTWHNERPYGAEYWTSAPWNLDVRDAIASAVHGHTTGLRFPAPGVAIGTLQTTDLANTAAFGNAVGFDASAPGMFTVPVCFTADYSWSTVVDGHRFPQNAWQNLVPTNPIKNLPCYCGLWGKDTMAVWDELGFPWKSWTYKVEHCGYQVFDRIREPLERYVAWCRLDMHTNLAGRTRFLGADGNCGVVTGLVDRLGWTPEEFKRNKPELYKALECRSGEADWNKRGGCKIYAKKSITQIINELEGDAVLH